MHLLSHSLTYSLARSPSLLSLHPFYLGSITDRKPLDLQEGVVPHLGRRLLEMQHQQQQQQQVAPSPPSLEEGAEEEGGDEAPETFHFRSVAQLRPRCGPFKWAEPPPVLSLSSPPQEPE